MHAIYLRLNATCYFLPFNSHCIHIHVASKSLSIIHSFISVPIACSNFRFLVSDSLLKFYRATRVILVQIAISYAHPFLVHHWMKVPFFPDAAITKYAFSNRSTAALLLSYSRTQTRPSVLLSIFLSYSA